MSENITKRQFANKMFKVYNGFSLSYIFVHLVVSSEISENTAKDTIVTFRVTYFILYFDLNSNKQNIRQ